MAQTANEWVAIEQEVAAEDEDQVAGLMFHFGAVGCELKQMGERRVVHAVFRREQLSDLVLQGIRSSLGSEISALQLVAIEEQDWLAKFKENFKPFTVGERLVVSPPWELPNLGKPGKVGRQVLIVEPGLAFGTGFHATTQYCLRQIEVQPVGANVLDFGTGSGILAIAAALLYPNVQVVAIDNDPVAITVAKENIELNQVQKAVRLIEGSLDAVDPSLQFDTILANLTAEDIVDLMWQMLQRMNTGGRLILAGILEEKASKVLNEARNYPLKLLDQSQEGLWTGLTLLRL